MSMQPPSKDDVQWCIHIIKEHMPLETQVPLQYANLLSRFCFEVKIKGNTIGSRFTWRDVIHKLQIIADAPWDGWEAKNMVAVYALVQFTDYMRRLQNEIHK